MKKAPLNIRTISKLCGVSTCTVSRVLSGGAKQYRISDETEKKVLAVARKAGYRPNYLAQSLNIGRTYHIGLVFANSVDAYLGGIMEGIEARLRETEFRLIVATCDNSPAVQSREIQRMLHRQVDGVILYPLALTRGQAHGVPSGLKPGSAPPVVLIGRTMPGRWDEVMFADVEAGQAAAAAFLERGCRRFALLTNDTRCSSDGDRCRGFLDALSRAGVSRSRVAVVARTGPPPRGELARLRDVDAVFAVNTGLLLEYLTALGQARHVRKLPVASVGVPDGRALMGLDHLVLDPPTRDLGSKAADVLLWRLDHPRGTRKRITLPIVAGDR